MDNANVGNPDAPAKTMFKWTFEHHSEFMDAVIELGGIEDAVPDGILRRMKVQGLTRDNVASHLQKIRELQQTGPGRMNKNARFHQQYLLTTSGGARIIQDWSRFLSACNNKYLPRSSSSSNNNNNVSGFANINVATTNYNQTVTSFAENVNLIPENHSSYPPHSAQGGEQQSPVSSTFEGENDIYSHLSTICDLPTLDNNTVGHDNSDGNHMVNLTNDINYQLNIDEDFVQYLFAYNPNGGAGYT